MSRILVRLLGPTDVVVDGISRPIRGLRRRTILALLGLTPGAVVSVDRLVEAVWGEHPPATVANTVQRHISDLRALLGDRTAIVARGAGYLLDLPVEAVDAAHFEVLIRDAVHAGDHAGNAARLRAALDLWRGQPLSDVADTIWLRDQGEHLERLRMSAVAALIDARMALGDHLRLVVELEKLAAEYPLWEHMHEHLMLSLYRSGRQSDALAAYQRLRRHLADDLGTDPSPELRDLESAILRHDPALGDAGIEPSLASPAQLPLTLGTFAGREAELAQLNAILPGNGDPYAARIAVIWGMAGVGKTALAIHWAHRIAAQFPDGQLHVNLRGFEPGGEAAEPAEVLRGLLETLGIRNARIPSTLDERVGLYRSLLSGKRMLLVFDNARDEDQVRPLLPGSPHALTVVTSRIRLSGLVAAQGAQPVAVEPPSLEVGREMLARRVGGAPVAADPDAVGEIIARCGRLPVAIAVVAARAVADTLSLKEIAKQLRDAAESLDGFDSHDPAMDVRVVLSCSYSHLSDAAARLFRLLSSGRGPDLSLDAIASLAGIAPATVRRSVAELVRAHLLTESGPGRYAPHDLVRAYAMEMSAEHDNPDDTSAAFCRLQDHYLHTAYTASLLLSSQRRSIDLDRIADGVSVTKLDGYDDALEWFTAEQSGLMAAARVPVPGVSWRLAWCLGPFLDRRGYYEDIYTLHDIALRAAQQAGDVAGKAHMHRLLGIVCATLGRVADADRHNGAARTLFAQLGDAHGQADVLMSLSYGAQLRRNFDEGIAYTKEAFALFEAVGHELGAAIALCNMSWANTHLGNATVALRQSQEAFVILERHGHRSGCANAIDNLGYALAALGDYPAAIRAYEQAAQRFEALQMPLSLAGLKQRLGDVYRRCGDLPGARAAWARGLEVLDRIDLPEADRIRETLRRHGDV